ncbi:MAG: hypothetical protein AAF191_20305 [Verrucomicrobiota bacterium]
MNAQLIFERRPLDPFCIEAVKAFEARFPGVRGICQTRRKWARTYLQIRNLCTDASEVLSRGLVLVTLILVVGVVVLAGGGSLKSHGVLTWLRVLVPIASLCAGGILGCSALKKAFFTDLRPQQVLWSTAGAVALGLSFWMGLWAAQGLGRIREVLPIRPLSFWEAP